MADRCECLVGYEGYPPQPTDFIDLSNGEATLVKSTGVTLGQLQREQEVRFFCEGNPNNVCGITKRQLLRVCLHVGDCAYKDQVIEEGVT